MLVRTYEYIIVMYARVKETGAGIDCEYGQAYKREFVCQCMHE